MSDILMTCAALLLLAIGGSLIRVLRGPTPADRMMGAQLAGTGGIAVLLLLAASEQRWVILDVALILALLAAFAVVGFAKAATEDGVGDPEEHQPW
jgi:multicomponent Na+:H+ antiporter subunit F